VIDIFCHLLCTVCISGYRPLFRQPLFRQPLFRQPLFWQPLFRQPLFRQSQNSGVRTQ